MRYSLLFFVCFSIGAQTAKAQPVDLARDVFPIFQARCTACHGPKSQMGQLRLDAKAIFERGGTSGKPVVAGKPDESLLVRRILASNGMSIMPPMGEPLSSENAGVIRRWIEQGAAWPQGVGADVSEVSRHWSYLRPMASTHRGRVYNIDDFIKEKLAGAGLKPSPRASKETLIRRLSLDLTGLPPTPAEVDAFLKDTDSTAYERLVDRLLASPHYGERWAQMWLDLARYADTNGYESDEPRTNWAWRDWVIKAFNRNMPFNQFTIEQLAGDLLPNPTEDQLIATGYHRNTLVNSEGGAKDDEFRDAAIKDRLENTSTVWLGSTIGCAQCHNHKYDPFSMKDYYRLYAFFNSTSESSIAVNDELKIFLGDKQELERRKAQLAPLEKVLETTTPEIALSRSKWGADFQAKFPMLEKAWKPLGEAGAASAVFQTGLRRLSALKISGDAKQTIQLETYTPSEWAEQRRLEARKLQWSNWFLAGPFEGFTVEEAHTTAWPPEKGVDLNAKYDNGRIEWVEKPKYPDGEFRILDGYNCASYLYRTVTAEKAQTVRVRVGSDLGVAVFLNGRKVKQTGTLEKLAPDDGLLALNLNAGKNGILLKYTNGPGYYRYFFQYYAGFEHEHLRPLQPIKNGIRALVKPVTSTEPLVVRLRFKGKEKAQKVEAGVFSGEELESLTAPADVTKALLKQTRTEEEEKLVASHYLTIAPALAEPRKQYAGLKKEFDEFFRKNSTTSMIMKELPAPRETFMQSRGNFLSKLDQVSAGVPSVLLQLDGTLPANRLTLARWLVSSENPLTGRVVVNHFWRAIFGQGLVKTGDDFGKQGDAPSHPELLDQLAVKFTSDWDVKQLLKAIVMSETYQQSSRVTPELLEKDPDNKLLSRAPRMRFTAEGIRDAALEASGLLSHKIGGESVFPPMPASVFENFFIETGIQAWPTSTGEDRYRRGMYTFYKRTGVYPAFMTFDAPERNVCTVDRPRSNTPLQALTTLNDQVFIEAAGALARRMLTTATTPRDRIEYGFRLTTARKPSGKELQSLLTLFEKSAARYKQDADASRQLVTSSLIPPPPGMTASEMAPWIVVSNVLLNLDEAVTKE